MARRTVVSSTRQSFPVSVRQNMTESMASRYDAVRRLTETLCEPLETEDYVVQSMPDVSPTRWHLAHTTWFFETFVLAKATADYQPFHPAFAYLFNSYYNAVGEQFPRPLRGVLSRPTVKEVFAYRSYVDDAMRSLLVGLDAANGADCLSVIETGLQHEQQHQELLLTDVKHVFSCNPLHPVYKSRLRLPDSTVPDMSWKAHDGGLQWIGYGGQGFCYDNERPRHRAFVQPFELASRPITNGEYLAFMEDGGYERADLWLSEGWATVHQHGWRAPLYWERSDDEWWQFTLSGMRRVDLAEPVCHVSYYEADAFARWSGAWLPFETAWEVAALEVEPQGGGFIENDQFHPAPADAGVAAGGLSQMFGDVWEWTCSPYVAYPGYRAPPGAIGEYNGKFMCNQMVLRGGSCLTSASHIRRTYRNFFPPDARWQCAGIRLAR